MSFNKTQKKVDKGKNIYKVSVNTRVPRVKCQGTGTQTVARGPISGLPPMQRSKR